MPSKERQNRNEDQSARYYKDAPEHMFAEKPLYRNQDAYGGAPRGYSADEERYDEGSDEYDEESRVDKKSHKEQGSSKKDS